MTKTHNDGRRPWVRRLISWLGLLIGALVFLPPLISLVVPDKTRSFEAVRLSETEHTEVRFRNQEQNLDLAGLVFQPPGEGPFPGAVIIHGSGTSQRDNGWYLTVAEYLQEHGVLVLLPDKRGSEQSDGDWRTSSFEDLATDTRAAVSYLMDSSDLSIDGIGLIGMSQGGRIAPIVAVDDPRISWVVNVVGPAVTGHEQLYYEEVHNLRQMGFLPGVSDLLAYPSSWMLINVTDNQFWDTVGNSDPIEDWRAVQQRSLVVYGDMDTNVPTAESVDRLERLANPNLRIDVYEGSGHAIEDPEGEGSSIFRKDALDDIVAFIAGSES